MNNLCKQDISTSDDLEHTHQNMSMELVYFNLEKNQILKAILHIISIYQYPIPSTG